MPTFRVSAFALTALVLSLVAVLAGPSPARASSAVQFGAWAPTSPWSGMAAVEDLESAVGRRLDVVHVFETWQRPYAHDSMLGQAASEGRAVLLTLEPWSPGGGTEQPEWALSTFLRGDHDARIRDWARGLRGFGAPVYLRPMHEMNGDWYPWSGVRNGNTAAEYVAVWRRIHALFSEVGATNVRWVWAPNVLDVPSTNRLEAYYPGAGYVDVLGLDGYNWGTSEPGYGGWLSFDQIFSDAYRRVTALGAQPVWITEVASDEQGGDKARWVRDMFAALPARYPRVSTVVWFNERKERDWPVTSSSASTAAFVDALSATTSTAPPPATSAPADGGETGTERPHAQRIAGRDRIHTARLAAEHAFGSGAQAAVIARADDHADALAGAAVAGALGGPVLLTARDRLSGDAAAALASLGVRRVVLLGGRAAIAPAVEEDLRAILGTGNVTRISGPDRFATAAAAAGELGTPGSLGDGRPTALLANGASFADALSAGPIAWRAGVPLLLTGAEVLPSTTRSAMADLGVRHVIVMGGRRAVSDAVVEALHRDGFTTERVAGPTRSGTSAAMASLAVERLGWPATSVALARGDAFADALALGPLAGKAMAPLLLAGGPDDLGADAAAWATRRGCQIDTVVLGGGPAALSAATEEAMKAAVRAPAC